MSRQYCSIEQLYLLQVLIFFWQPFSNVKYQVKKKKKGKKKFVCGGFLDFLRHQPLIVN
jgi:hypothetical protein